MPNGLLVSFEDGSEVVFRPTRPQTSTTPDRRRLDQELLPWHTLDDEIPNAMVGYQPGYGEIDDFYPQNSSTSYTRIRVLVMVSVKNGYAVIAAADGPYKEFKPPPDGDMVHPSGANFDAASCIGNFVNSFTWKGDPPR